MKAVVLLESRNVALREVPDAEMCESTDVLLRLTSTAICGTDLHFYEGRMPGLEGHVIGHEPLGVVEEAGSAVKSIKQGDRVVVPTHICCGFCEMCVDGYSSACLTAYPGHAGAAYGYPNKGGYEGGLRWSRRQTHSQNSTYVPGAKSRWYSNPDGPSPSSKVASRAANAAQPEVRIGRSVHSRPSGSGYARRLAEAHASSPSTSPP